TAGEPQLAAQHVRCVSTEYGGAQTGRDPRDRHRARVLIKSGSPMHKLRVWPVVAAALISAGAVYGQDRRVPVSEPPTGRRVAMVIGNDAYAKVPLRNAVNDANAMARALTDAGFQVDLLLNATLKDFDSRLPLFWSQLRDGDVALFYYSGHGVQVENENYLVPVDFAATSEADAKYSAYPASRIVDHMSESGARLN